MTDKPSAQEEAQRKQIPIGDEVAILKLPSSPSEKPWLIGSKCRVCGEVFFPNQPQCSKCYTETTEEIALSTRGKVYSSTVVYIPPPLYKGPVPYGIGHVELPEGVLIPTLFTEVGPEPLPIGTEVELVIEKLEEDEEGNDIIAYKFKPV